MKGYYALASGGQPSNHHSHYHHQRVDNIHFNFFALDYYHLHPIINSATPLRPQPRATHSLAQILPTKTKRLNRCVESVIQSRPENHILPRGLQNPSQTPPNMIPGIIRDSQIQTPNQTPKCKSRKIIQVMQTESTY
jgi:hypothetical protein